MPVDIGGGKEPQTTEDVPSYTKTEKVSKSCTIMAEECLNNRVIAKNIMKKIGRRICGELRRMCSNSSPSILRSQNLDDLSDFNWDKVYSELQDRAPTFLQFLMASTKTKTERKDQRVTVCVFSSIILKYRFQHMSLLHKIIGLLLYGVNANKMVNLIT